MSFEGLLVNKVSVYRPTVSYTKGVPKKSYPATPTSTNIPCNIQAFAFGQNTLVPKMYGYENEEPYIGYFKYGADIAKDDKIVDESSREFIVKSDPLDTVGIQHHQEVRLAIVE